jgi:hypothetical protein
MSKTCEKCGKKMTFWNSGAGPHCATCISLHQKGLDMPVPGPRSPAGGKLVCRHCGFDQFASRSILINKAAIAFLDLDLFEQDAEAHTCTRCGCVHWFGKLKPLDSPIRIPRV